MRARRRERGRGARRGARAGRRRPTAGGRPSPARAPPRTPGAPAGRARRSRSASCSSAPVRPPAEPAGVRPEEVVEIAELVGVHGGPPAAEAARWRRGRAARRRSSHERTGTTVNGGTSVAPGLASSAPGRPARRHQPSSSVSAASTSVRCVNAWGKFPTRRPASDVVLLGEQAEVVAERRAAARRAPPPRRGGPGAPSPGRARTSTEGTSLRPGGSPSTPVFSSSARYRSTSPSRTRCRSIAATVLATRGSSTGRKPTSGISSRLASSRAEPKDCVNAPSSSSNPLRQTSSWISSRSSRQRSTGPSSPSLVDAPHRTVERHPRHHLRVREVAPRSTHLPDPLVGLAPAVLEPLEQLARQRPRLLRRLEPRDAARGTGRPGPRRTRRADAGRRPRCRSARGSSPRIRRASRPRARSAAARRRSRT